MGLFLRDQPPLTYGGRRPPYKKAAKRPKILDFMFIFDQNIIEMYLIIMYHDIVEMMLVDRDNVCV